MTTEALVVTDQRYTFHPYPSSPTVSVRPRWLAPVVLWSLLAHVLLVAALTAWYWRQWSGPLDESVMWTSGALVLVPMAAMAVAAIRVPERGNAGEVLLRWTFHLPLLLALMPIDGLLTIWANAQGVDARDLAGIDYVPGGALLAVVIVGSLGFLALWMIGIGVTFILAMPASIPIWMRFGSLPLILHSTVLLAVGGTLGVDTGAARWLAAIWKALAADGEVTSAGWLLIARVAFVGLVVGVLLMLVVGWRLAKGRSGPP